MFCFVKYFDAPAVVDATTHATRLTRIVDRFSRSPTRNKIQFQMDKGNKTSPTRLSNTEEEPSGSLLSNQLVMEKSMELLRQLRSKLNFETDSETTSKSVFRIIDEGEDPPNDNLGSTIASILPTESSKSAKTVKSAESKSNRHSIRIRLSKNKTSTRSPRTSHRQDNKRASLVEYNYKFMINPDCYVQILLDYIHEELHIDKAETNLDLCDDNGVMLKLFNLQKFENALSVLQNRKTYYVVSYELNEDGTFKNLYPIFRQTNKDETNLVSNIYKQINKIRTIKLDASSIILGKSAGRIRSAFV